MLILVTGGTGFLGSHLVDALVSSGHRVLAYAREGSSTHRRGDVEWFSLKDGAGEEPFSRGQVDAIIHMATCYGRSGESVPFLLEANLLLPVLLANWAVKYKVPLFINTDTYFNQGDEGYSLLPDYSLSKHNALYWLKRCTAGTSLSFVNMRLEHVYGPGDRPEKFCAHMLRAMSRNEPQLLLTSGKQRRDFIHVDDVVKAFLAVLKNWTRTAGQTAEFGVGWGVSTPIRDFIMTGHKLAASTTELLFGALPDRPADFAESKADNESLRGLGWTPGIDLADGIQMTLKSLKSDAAR